MDANYDQLIDGLLPLLGGARNVERAGHCLTRLRIKPGRPLWAAVVGGLVGGCHLGVTGVVAYAWTPALAAVVAYFGDTTVSMVNALVGTGLAFGTAFALTLALGFEDPPGQAS